MVQFIGKDNIFFHALFFPAMTMGQDQPYKLVDSLPANEFLTLEGKQFSKTEGWTIDLEAFLKQYSADQLRYTLAANAPETSDAEFTWKDFQMRCNAELLGKFGNLANRTLVFAQRQCEGKIPPAQNNPKDDTFLKQIDELTDQIRTAYQSFHLRRACQLIMELASLGNTYFNDCQPWVAAKNEATRGQMQTTVHNCLICLKALAIVAAPIIPTTADQLWGLLGQSLPLPQWDAGLSQPLEASTPLPPPTILFRKIEDEEIAAELARLQATNC